MKLKKIVSLALAGVLAVSMLAGCNNGTGSSSSTTEQPAATDLVSQVAAKLSEVAGDKLTASADAELQNALEMLAKKKGADTTAYTNANATNLNDYDVDLSMSTTKLTTLETAGQDADATDAKKCNYTLLFYVNSDSNQDYVVNSIVSKIEDEELTTDSFKLETLPVKGNDVGSGAAGKTCYYAFKYTAKVAVTPIVDGATSTLTTYYAVAVDITRTPTKVDLT